MSPFNGKSEATSENWKPAWFWNNLNTQPIEPGINININTGIKDPTKGVWLEAITNLVKLRLGPGSGQ